MESEQEAPQESVPDDRPMSPDAQVSAAPDDSEEQPDDSEPANGPQLGEKSGMPDPSTILVMAAMHLQVSELLQVLVTVFDAHAWRSMGLVADHTGEVHKDMPAAKTAIDSLAFVLGKVEATLDDSQKRDVQRRLADLRMNYVTKVSET